MKKHIKILLIGIVAITLLDSIGSIASRKLDFDYSNLFYISYAIFAIIAFVSTRVKNLKIGILHAAILGLYDATVGWKISMLLDANTAGTNNQLSIGIWIGVCIMMILVASIIGLFAGALALFTKRNTRTQQ